MALYKGIKAQRVPRRLMDYIVHMRDDTKTSSLASGTLNAGTQPPSSAPIAITSPVNVPVNAEKNQADSWSAALKIIAEESGVSVEELVPEASFTDLGVDSLLALLCASRFREELDLPYESSIFMDFLTLKELEQFWKQGTPETTTVGSGRDAVLNSMFADRGTESDKSTGEDQSLKSDSQVEPSSSLTSSETDQTPSPMMSATSLLIQGNHKLPSTVKTLFLLPDGSGSSASYATIPRISPSLAVIGLNCPFRKNPEYYTCGIQDISDAYIREIQRRQPHGPYSLGGWSAGGIFAYHVAQQLTIRGETVTELILIDSPVPRGLDHLPRRYWEYCDTIGLFGTCRAGRKEPPKWLIPHFVACVNSLHPYHATPFPIESEAPRTLIIWACDAVDKHLEPKFERKADDPEGLKFLTAARTDFGPCGWETVLPEPTLSMDKIPGANHFSMMQGEYARRLQEVIEGFIMDRN